MRGTLRFHLKTERQQGLQRDTKGVFPATVEIDKFLVSDHI